MRRDDPAYQSWLWGQVLLFGLLAAALALFAAHPQLRPTYELPQVRLVLDTLVSVAAALVAVLAGVRFSVEGRRLDLFLCAGFSIAAGATFAFGIAPVLGGQPLHRTEQWTWIWSSVLASAFIAGAAFAKKRVPMKRRELTELLFLVPFALAFIWAVCQSFGDALPTLAPSDHDQPWLLSAALGLRALLTLVSNRYVTQGDFLRLLSYAVLLVGVWRAIQHAEFGRAVAEERARVAREIHDGLAQYLFAISTYASRLEDGAPVADVVPELKRAA